MKPQRATLLMPPNKRRRLRLYNYTLALLTSLGIVSKSSGAITATDLYQLRSPNGLRYTPFEGNRVAAGGQITGQARMVGSPFNPLHAVLWHPSATNGIDLNPAGFRTSEARGTNGSLQVGEGVLLGSNSGSHALLWGGSPESYIDLHPIGYSASAAYATVDTEQVGWGYRSRSFHALRWAGNASSVTDLHPTWLDSSRAFGTNGTQQVGSGTISDNASRAVLWSGSAETAVDLHPSWLNSSVAVGVRGLQQVGYGSMQDVPVTNSRALLWTGSAESAIDLTPDGFDESAAFDTDGMRQVGFAKNSGLSNALLWNGSSTDYINLHHFLPTTLVSSYAYTISGSSVYGFAYGTNLVPHAIVWHIPEPTSISLLAFVTLLERKRKKV